MSGETSRRSVHIDVDFNLPGDGDWRDDPLFDQIAELVHARDDLDNQTVGGSLTDGTCGLCRGHASGLASIDDQRYCHGDDDPAPTCFEVAQLRATSLPPWTAALGTAPFYDTTPEAPAVPVPHGPAQHEQAALWAVVSGAGGSFGYVTTSKIVQALMDAGCSLPDTVPEPRRPIVDRDSILREAERAIRKTSAAPQSPMTFAGGISRAASAVRKLREAGPTPSETGVQDGPLAEAVRVAGAALNASGYDLSPAAIEIVLTAVQALPVSQREADVRAHERARVAADLLAHRMYAASEHVAGIARTAPAHDGSEEQA